MLSASIPRIKVRNLIYEKNVKRECFLYYLADSRLV